MRTPTGNLAQDAVAAFRQIFSAYQPTESQYATRNSIIRGTYAQGWDYFMIKNAIRISGGNYAVLFGFVFVAGIGNRDGAWSLDGQAVVLTKDNDKANPSKGWIRLEQESYDNGNTWSYKLYLLRTSTVDGKEYEMNYHRDK